MKELNTHRCEATLDQRNRREGNDQNQRNHKEGNSQNNKGSDRRQCSVHVDYSCYSSQTWALPTIAQGNISYRRINREEAVIGSNKIQGGELLKREWILFLIKDLGGS